MCSPFAPSSCRARTRVHVTAVDLFAVIAGSAFWGACEFGNLGALRRFPQRACGSLPGRSVRQGRVWTGSSVISGRFVGVLGALFL